MSSGKYIANVLFGINWSYCVIVMTAFGARKSDQKGIIPGFLVGSLFGAVPIFGPILATKIASEEDSDDWF